MRYLIGYYSTDHNGPKTRGEVHTVARYNPDTPATDGLLEQIGRSNGNGANNVRRWLEDGSQVHTNFSIYVIEDTAPTIRREDP